MKSIFFQIQQIESNAERLDIINSDEGFDILEKIGYLGAPKSVEISDKFIQADQSPAKHLIISSKHRATAQHVKQAPLL